MKHTAQDVIREKGSELLTVGLDTTVQDAVRRMAENDIGGLLVVDQDQKVLGIFTERECVRRLVTEQMDPRTATTGQFMSTPLPTITPGTSIETCMSLMTTHRTRYLLVGEEGQKPAGLMSIGDVVKALLEAREFVLQRMEEYLHGRPDTEEKNA